MAQSIQKGCNPVDDNLQTEGETKAVRKIFHVGRFSLNTALTMSYQAVTITQQESCAIAKMTARCALYK